MTRQRKAQLENNKEGLCGTSRAHGPVYKGGKCKACYEAALERYHDKHPGSTRYGPRHLSAIRRYENRIAIHEKWIAKYKEKLSELKAKLP